MIHHDGHHAVHHDGHDDVHNMRRAGFASLRPHELANFSNVSAKSFAKIFAKRRSCDGLCERLHERPCEDYNLV